MASATHGKPHVAFLHPDLGIGGAEMLIMNVALSLQDGGHNVEILTSHFDPKHAFTAAQDGTLKVVHAKTCIPRSIFHMLHLPMAIMQQLSLVFQVYFAARYASLAETRPKLYNALCSVAPQPFADVYVVDQLSIAVPLIRLLYGRRVLFYCHFPDKKISASLAQQAGTHGLFALVRRLYRAPLDLLEEVTTAFSDVIVANSKFTARHFRDAFPRIRQKPLVVYPGVAEAEFDPMRVEKELEVLEERDTGSVQRQMHIAVQLVLNRKDSPTFVSVNRFEAKKNIALALDTIAMLRQKNTRRVRLICAGGYDPRVRDNIDTLRALEQRAKERGLTFRTLWYKPREFEPPISPPSATELANADVLFCPSFPGPMLRALLLSPAVLALLYTPTDEHFGIVPVEAMACGVPVIATNTGGPLETIVDAEVDADGTMRQKDATGFLLPPNPALWANVCNTLLHWDISNRETISVNAKRRVKDTFSVNVMRDTFNRCVDALGHRTQVTWFERVLSFLPVLAVLLMLNGALCAMVWLFLWVV
ncbi:hypothetical protein MVES1_003127 [Malassezia vespertilionis]|uniref:Alpha-1,3/1,6-mannosyltransferase ALG2 n=1 Tax=Malassezia vespertilionis TaxID=2020962 RepID=A0A2N1J8U4_9BASI|nr:uncharacterized protein MVES1_003127 [Malassezia vespertilionis]PKI82975.1 Alg2p [Malassezia vespertilionis]WFD07757.1 hypothetical protein MVES1_003127 [Malassezia vespertilionis]